MVCVYEAVCQTNGKRYVGVTNNLPSRRRSHAHAARTGSRSLFHRAIRKHGIDGFVFHVRAELPTDAEAKIAERLLIATECPEYNMSAGGDGAVGVRHSEERRQLQRNLMTGRKHTAETRAKQSAAHKGRVFSAETCQKLSESTKLRHQNTPHPMLGREHSPDARLKISLKKRANNIAKRLLKMTAENQRVAV